MKHFSLMIFLLLGGIFGVSAQDNVSAVFRFGDVLDIALENHPQLKQFEARVQAKRGEWWQGIGLASPEISYLSEGMPTDGDGFAERRWTISQQVDFPLQSFFRMQRLRAERQSRSAELAAYHRDLVAQLKNAYADVAYALKLRDLRKQQFDIFNDLQGIAQTRVDVGEAAALELLKINIQLAEAENDLTDAENSYEQARYELFRLMGIDPDEQSYDVAFTDTLRFFAVTVDQESALRQLPDQPQLVSRDAAFRAAKFQSLEAWSSFLPDISLSFYKQDYGSGYDFNGYEVGLSIPLWFPFNQRGEIQRAHAVQNEAKWERQRVLLQLKADIENAWHSYQASLEVIERFDNVIRRQAEQLLQLTREAYQLGEIDVLNLLDSQRTYLDSQQRYQKALRDYYRQLIALERVLGEELVFKEKG